MAKAHKAIWDRAAQPIVEHRSCMQVILPRYLDHETNPCYSSSCLPSLAKKEIRGEDWGEIYRKRVCDGYRSFWRKFPIAELVA